jgi:hypothetical protein
MRRVFLVLLLLAAVAVAAPTIRLYLTDGGYHLVREYEVKGDRVRFYSTERGSWEEMPVELVDLERTETEMNARRRALAEETKILTEEDRVARQLQEEILKIPANPGVYYLENDKAVRIRNAESIVRTSKGRSVLGALSPIPVVAGKGRVELQGNKSLNVIHNPEQEFYIQLSAMERFGIVKLTPKGGVRIVEQITIIPVTKEIIEEPEEVEIFRKQLTPDGLYKIWPMQPLQPGEYAVVQYTSGKLNIQVFDFSYQPAKPAK